MTKPDILLLDGDVLAFRSTVAVQETIDWGDGLWTTHSELSRAIDVWRGLLNQITRDCQCSDIIITLSDSENFRKTVMPTYKANRKGKPKPIAYKAMLAWIQDTYGKRVRSWPTLEADDVMGIIATAPGWLRRSIIVTIDKDLRQIPCRHYNPDHGDRGVEQVTRKEGERFHLFQTLTGDSTDGYGGCPKVGPVKAEQILQEGAWFEVLAAYMKAGLSGEVALQNARVAKILEHTNYKRRNKEIVHWTPKT